jgi:multidrug resistance efflux pump
MGDPLRTLKPEAFKAMLAKAEQRATAAATTVAARTKRIEELRATNSEMRADEIRLKADETGRVIHERQAARDKAPDVDKFGFVVRVKKR